MSENIFETIKKVDSNGAEYWTSRELANALNYSNYHKFINVIDKAKIACENSGEVIHNHFVQMDDMVKIGSGAERPIDTFYLSRYACYLIVQNSDPTKVVVAKGQTYFDQQKKLFAAGPLMISEKENSPACGSLLIVDFENIETVKQWFFKDPYYMSGVYKTVDVIPYIDAMPFLKG